MPIYAYRCSSCGHAKDVLQKLSDAPLTTYPACGAESFTKQLTAAGFQLKGSGWYVTDFRGGNSGGGSAAAPADSAKGGADTGTGTSSTGTSDSGGTGAASSDSSASAGTACGGSCACH